MSSSQTLRGRVADFWRTLSSKDCDDIIRHNHNDPTHRVSGRSKSAVAATDDHHETFIHRYLNGRNGGAKRPEIHHGKSCYDLPSHTLAYMVPTIVATHTGPNQGLTSVKLSQGADAFTPSDEVQFIDEATPMPKSSQKDEPENISPIGDEIAGVSDWFNPKDFACGMATSLYESNPLTNERTGEPIADAFALCVRENSSIMALADGVNWGVKSCLAAQCAVQGCMDYLNKALFGGAYNVTSTLDIFACLLRSFETAHNLILKNEALLTTLCATVICPLEDGRYAVCVCNVGDSFAYVFNEKQGVREVTLGSHDIFSMRDMRDALGALGPVDGTNPELNNLTVSLTIAEEGDIVFLTSDGISDNFDPVVGKFALAKRSIGHERRESSSKSSNRTNGQGSVKRSASHRISPMSEKTPLPSVEAHQRHALTLLRMEDILRNSANGADEPVRDAKELCERMIEFAKGLTTAKRRILEDPELYSDASCTNRDRRQRVCQKLAAVPGKLDHASLCAVRLGRHVQTPSERCGKKSIKDARKAFFDSESSLALTSSSATSAATTPEKNNNLTIVPNDVAADTSNEREARSTEISRHSTPKRNAGKAPLCSFESMM